MQDLMLIESAAREVAERQQPKKRPGDAFFGSTMLPKNPARKEPLAPGPQGPPAAQLIEDARRRRRERAEEERTRRGR